MKLKDLLPAAGAYLTRRLAEPESRAAVGAGVAAAAAYVAGQIGGGALGTAELGAAVAFLVPAPIARPVMQAIGGALAKKPAA